MQNSKTILFPFVAVVLTAPLLVSCSTDRGAAEVVSRAENLSEEDRPATHGLETSSGKEMAPEISAESAPIAEGPEEARRRRVDVSKQHLIALYDKQQRIIAELEARSSAAHSQPRAGSHAGTAEPAAPGSYSPEAPRPNFEATSTPELINILRSQQKLIDALSSN